MIEYNLEEGMPTVADALNDIKMIIAREKSSKRKVLVFIHGYGSSGKGGAIRIKTREWLNAQIRNGKLKAVVGGENFDMFNEDARKIKDADSETMKYYGKGNHGITVVML